MASWKQTVDSEWTLFLDRDGTINERIMDGYVTRWEDFHFLPGVLEALELASSLFGKVLVVTNQQGVGKQLMTVEELNAIHQQMIEVIQSSNGRIDGVYSATELRGQSPSRRKPNIAMAREACDQYPEIDLGKAIMIGDTSSDIAFGKAAGMRTILVGNEAVKVEADFRCADLLTAMNWLQQA